MPAELTFRFLIDGPIESQEFLDATVGVSCRGFSGATRFTIARRDLAAFAADVASLRRGEVNVVRLVGGWDTARERLRLVVTRAGMTSSCTIRVCVADTGPRTDQWDRVETQFASTMDAVTAFTRALTSGTNSAELLGDEDSTV